MPDAPGVMAGWRGAPAPDGAAAWARAGAGFHRGSTSWPLELHQGQISSPQQLPNHAPRGPAGTDSIGSPCKTRGHPGSESRPRPAGRRRKESHATWCQRISVSARHRHRHCLPARLRIFRAGVIGSSNCGDCKSRRSSSCRWPIMRPPPRCVPATVGWSRAALAPASSWPAPQVPITRSPRSRQHWAGSMPPATGSAGNAACPCRPHGWKPARSAAIAPAAAPDGAGLPRGQGRLDSSATGRRGIIRLGRLAANCPGWRRRTEARPDDGDGAAGGRRA